MQCSNGSEIDRPTTLASSALILVQKHQPKAHHHKSWWAWEQN